MFSKLCGDFVGILKKDLVRKYISVSLSFILMGLALAQDGITKSSFYDPNSKSVIAQERGFTIGAVLPLSGALDFLGPLFFDAAMLAIDEVNSVGGILGVGPIQLELRDSGSNGDTAAASADELIQGLGVPVIFATVRLPMTRSHLTNGKPNRLQSNSSFPSGVVGNPSERGGSPPIGTRG